MRLGMFNEYFPQGKYVKTVASSVSVAESNRTIVLSVELKKIVEFLSARMTLKGKPVPLLK